MVGTRNLKYRLKKNRLCNNCLIVEDEIHFMLNCPVYETEQSILFKNVAKLDLYFIHMTDLQKFTFLLSHNDRRILTWLGKYLHKAFLIKNSH